MLDDKLVRVMDDDGSTHMATPDEVRLMSHIAGLSVQLGMLRLQLAALRAARGLRAFAAAARSKDER